MSRENTLLRQLDALLTANNMLSEKIRKWERYADEDLEIARSIRTQDQYTQVKYSYDLRARIRQLEVALRASNEENHRLWMKIFEHEDLEKFVDNHPSP